MKERPHFLPSIVASIMLLIAITPMANGYYTILRWVIFIAALFVQGIGITLFRKKDRIWWVVIVFGFIAILFNPINPADLAQLELEFPPARLWILPGLVCSVLFIFTGCAIKKSVEETWDVFLYFGLLIGAAFLTTIAFCALLLIRDFLMVFN